MKETINNLRKVFKFGKNYTWAFIIEIITSIIQIIIGVILPLFLARQIVLLTDNIYKELILISLAVLLIEILDVLNNAIIAKVCQIFRRGTTKNIQLNLGKEILKICEKDIENYGTGTFIERLTGDVEKMSEIFTKGVGYLSGVIINIGIFIAILLINKIVFCYYLLVAIILTMLYIIQTNKIGMIDIKYRKQKDKVAGLIGELVRGEKDIKMLSAKESFINKLEIEITDKNNKFNDMRTLAITSRILIHSITHIFEFLLIILLVKLVESQRITVAIAVALFTYKTNIMTNLMEKVSLLLEEVKNFNISANRVFSIMNSKEFKKEKFGKDHLANLQGEFEFKKVEFSYGDYQVLNKTSFKVNKGETVAFIGKSGSGKSTIFNLLGKLYTIDKGQILLDGIDINTLDEDSIRKNMTIITQNPYIFNMSIRDNFKLIKKEITEEEIIEALKLACLNDFIKTLPKGIDTIIGEGGTNLSGGQRQRLAIARALIQETQIILFDEATSALDNETQKNIQKAIENLKGKYTIMIIAHRLSTIINSDRIMLVEKGKIIEEGTHKELLKNSKAYRKLYESELLENE